MKKSFRDIQECIHTFAQFSQESGKCGNVFFEGNIIYSYGYHFPMAVLVRRPNREPVVLINGNTYSVSTSRHQQWTRHALSHYRQIIVMGMGRDFYLNNAGDVDSHTHHANELYYIRELDTIANNLSVARKPQIWIDKAQYLDRQIREYTEFFGGKLSADYEKAYFDATNPSEEKKKLVQAQQANALEMKKAREAENKKAWSEKIAEWLANEREYFPSLTGNLSWEDSKKFTDILRIRENGKEVETSKGIIMTIAEAKAIYLQLASQQLKAGDTVLDAYTVTSINGVVKIGCHTFETAYLLKFGEELTGIHPAIIEMQKDVKAIKNS